jgi:chromosomal replication initiator protein
VVELLTELPLPGRTFVASGMAAAIDSASATLPSFVAGPENRLVAAAFDRLLSQHLPDRERRRPTSLFALYGPSGTGKTHLARGVVRYWQQRCGAESGEYLTSTDFRRELADAIEAKCVDEFRQRLRTRRLLALDDLDKLPDDPHLLEELRNTLDALDECGSIVIVTSARPASALSNLSPDLQSRLAAGLVLQLAPPGGAARQRLVQQAAAALHRSVSDAAANGLAGAISGTASDIFGAVLELCANLPPSASDGMVTDAQADDYLASRNARRPSLREIVSVVSKYYRVPQKVLKSSSRKQSAVYARATAVYLARELAGLSYENIGAALGGRDHTTMMHSYSKIRQASLHDLATREALEELRRILLAR